MRIYIDAYFSCIYNIRSFEIVEGTEIDKTEVITYMYCNEPHDQKEHIEF